MLILHAQLTQRIPIVLHQALSPTTSSTTINLRLTILLILVTATVTLNRTHVLIRSRIL
jgi:hypothetical protein